MNCNLFPKDLGNYGDRVSIPNRDFDELQLNFPILPTKPKVVSIPNRDFDELQSGQALFLLLNLHCFNP